MGKNVDEAYEQFNDTVNMSVSELKAWKESNNYDTYAEKKAGGQPIDEPREDVIQLLETPKSDWEDADDGFNEVTQANEVEGFVSRMSAGEQGDPMPGSDPDLSKRDASLLNWGHDPSPDTSDFVGDRQR